MILLKMTNKPQTEYKYIDNNYSTDHNYDNKYIYKWIVGTLSQMTKQSQSQSECQRIEAFRWNMVPCL